MWVQVTRREEHAFRHTAICHSGVNRGCLYPLAHSSILECDLWLIHRHPILLSLEAIFDELE